MKNGGTGIGSASILLVFAVLCIEIFSVISLTSARAGKIMTDKFYATVCDYYEADLLAERVLEAVIASDTIPSSACGIELSAQDNVVSFNCPVSEERELYVEAEISDGSAQVLVWRVVDTGEWIMEDDFEIWSGEL